MPTGPDGGKRPADVIANAVLSMRIATGEATETYLGNRRTGGMKGGKARSEALSAARRREIARKAAEAGWAAKRGWSMTVCVAALYGDGAGVVLAADGMVTAQLPIGYEFEHQENTRLVELAGATSTHALVAGDVLRGNEILEAAQAQLAQKDGGVIASQAAEFVRGA